MSRSRLVVRAADHRVVGITTCRHLALTIAIEVVIFLMEKVDVPPFKVAVLEQDVMKSIGMVVALLTAFCRSIGQQRVGRPTQVLVGLEPAFRAAVAQRVAEITPHDPDQLVEPRRSLRRLEFLDGRNPERSAAGEV